MATDWGKYAEPSGTNWEAYAERDPWEKYAEPTRPGSAASDPLQVQGVTAGERLKLQNLAPSPESAVKWLNERGYEAQAGRGGQISVRRPGGRWKVVDPKGFEWSDITDIGNELVSGGATVAGAMAGGVAGAGLASGGAEALRRGGAHLAGFEQTGKEVAQGIAEEALYGAGSELGLKALGAGFRATGHGFRALRGGRSAASKEAIEGATGTAPRKLLPSSTIRRKTPGDRPAFRSDAMPSSTVRRRAPGELEGIQGTRVKAGSGTRSTNSETVNTAQQAAASLPKNAKLKGNANSSPPSKLNYAKPESVEQILKESEEGHLRVVFEKADGSTRIVDRAHLQGPKFLARERSDEALVSMPTLALRRYAMEREGIEGAMSMGRTDLLQAIWAKQPGVIKKTGKPRKSKSAQVFWEELVEGKSKQDAIEKARAGLLSSAVQRGGKDLGQWRSFNKGRVVEIQRGDEVIRFNADGVPFVHKAAARAGKVRSAMGKAAGKVADMAEAPYRAEQSLIGKFAEGDEGAAWMAKRVLPFLVPGYTKIAIATRLGKGAGKVARVAKDVLENPGRLQEMARSGSAKMKGVATRILQNPKNEAVMRMAVFTLMHDPAFRAWANKREAVNGSTDSPGT